MGGVWSVGWSFTPTNRPDATHREWQIPVSHRYSNFSRWWVHGCPQHAEKINKYTKQNCAPSWIYLQERQVFSVILAADLQSIATFFCFPRGRFPLHRNNKFTIDNGFLSAFAKFRKATIRFVVSVRPRETTRSPMDRFSWNRCLLRGRDFPPISATVFLYAYCKQQDSTVTARVFRWSTNYFSSYFTQTYIYLTKVSKNCQPRISRKSNQQEPSSFMRMERHNKANSCFSCLII